MQYLQLRAQQGCQLADLLEDCTVLPHPCRPLTRAPGPA